MNRSIYIFCIEHGRNLGIAVVKDSGPDNGSCIIDHKLLYGYDDISYKENVEFVANELLQYIEKHVGEIDGIIADYNSSEVRDVLEACRCHEKSILYESKNKFDKSGFPTDYPPKTGKIYSARELGLSD